MDAGARMRATFLLETGKLLDELCALLLARENAGELTPDDIDRSFRILHTVKGSAGMMGLPALSSLAHALEDLLSRVREAGGHAGQGAALFDLLLGAADAIRADLEDIAQGGAEKRGFDELIARVRAFGGQDAAPRALRVTFTEDCALPSVRAYLIVTALKGVCPSVACEPENLESDENASARIRAEGLLLRFPAAYERAVRQTLEKDIYVAGVAAAVAPAPQAPAEKPPEHAPGQDGYLSVRLSKLEELQRLANTVVSLQSKVLTGALRNDPHGDAARLASVSETLRTAMVALRMTPVAQLFQMLHRAVREAGRRLSREVEFIATGGEVEIDKSILDALAESLVQIVRNAVVHGIEDAGERLRAGKPLMGKITVAARNVGASVVITVRDDGRGVDAQKVARAANAETPDTPAALLALLTRPGVTTSARADELSGRGVGMDVVRSAVARLRGSVSLETKVGEGAAFHVRVPQTLSLMDCVHLRAGNTVFLLPAPDVYRLVAPGEGDITRAPDGGRTLRFAGYALPLVDLAARFATRADEGDGVRGVAAVIEGEHSAVAVYADELLGLRRAVVRPLPALLAGSAAHSRGISALCVLDGGEIGFILDAEALLDL